MTQRLKKKDTSKWTPNRAPLAPGWFLWRQLALRSAGFPASLSGRLQHPRLTDAVDAWIDREKDSGPAALDERAQLQTLFDNAEIKTASFLREMAQTPKFIEAVSWQNPRTIRYIGDSLLNKSVTQRNSKIRQREEFFARYLLRYCLKNDTIGFFGPLCWGRIEPEAPSILFRPGSQIIDGCDTFFEHWGIDLLAAKLSQDLRLRPWLAPRRLPVIRIDQTSVVDAMGKSVELSPDALRILACCNGELTAGQIAANMKKNHDGQDQDRVFQRLEEFLEKGWIIWALEIPNIEPYPELYLRRMLERIEDPDLRKEILAPMDELEARLTALIEAKGDPATLLCAMDALDETFTRVTGQKAARREGQTYASRTLIFQDCRRDGSLVAGPGLLERIAPPFKLILDSARWFTFHVGRLYQDIFDQTFDQLRSNKSTVDMLAFLIGSLEHFPFIAHHSGPFPIPDIARPLIDDLNSRWRRLLQITPGQKRIHRTSGELAPEAQKLFPAPMPGWPSARYHSPDIMIAAASADAARRGEFLTVLGEIHITLNTLECPAAFLQHPNPIDFFGVYEELKHESRIAPAIPKDRVSSRVAIIPMSRDAMEFAFDATRSWRPPSQVLAVSELLVERMDGHLMVNSRDGAHQFHIFEFYDWLLSMQFAGELKILQTEDYAPRVTIDELVVSRETWRFRKTDLPFFHISSQLDRFIEVRRWARRHGFPPRVFFKASEECKPFLLDLESPISVQIFIRMAKSSSDIKISEMLPTTEQLWLEDSEGWKYTSELRTMAVDDYSWQPYGSS